jgi:hypothetical protein
MGVIEENSIEDFSRPTFKIIAWWDLHTNLNENSAIDAFVIESFSAAVRALYLTNSVALQHEGSSPHSQDSATGPYPEPVESTSHTPSQPR